MKKSLLVLTAALTFGGLASAQTTATSSAAQVPTLTDVPAGHWAKDAIDKLVSKGIILGYPDGTFRGTQNLTRYEAAVIIARLLDQMAQGQVPAGSIDPETLASLQNAIQELAADLAALGVRVTDLEENAVTRDDFNALQDKVDMLGAATGVDPEAMAALQAQLDDLTARADDYDTLRADVDDNASSIAALNDLTVLLNQDILDLQDRVSAVEAAQADFVQRADFDALGSKVSGIDTRVKTLEGAPKFSVGGELGVAYGRIALISGISMTGNNIPVDFDVDRLTRQTFADGVFSTGVNCPGGAYAFNNNAVNCVDTNNNTYGGYVNFGVKASNLTTANGKITVNNAAINFYTTNNWGFPGDVGVAVDNASADGTFNGQKFDVSYSPWNSKFKFNDYLFANDNDTEGAVQRRGAVINIQASQLPLQPKLTVVAGVAKANNGGGVAGFVGPYYGLRASVNPGDAGTFGVSFAQNDNNRSALGADWDTKLGPVSLTGAYVISSPTSNSLWNNNITTVFANSDKAFYTDAKADLGMFKVAANYHAVDPDFGNGKAGMSGNDAPYYLGAQGYKSSMPYGPDSVGFGGGVGTTLGPVALAAFGDTYTEWNSSSPRNTSFGVAAGVQFAGLSLKGFYNSATENGTGITVDGNNFGYNLTSPYMDTADVPMAYSSTFGGILKHDGKADDALVKNLNFTVADAYFYTVKANDLQVYGDYSATIGGVKIAPFARYHLFMAPSGGATDSTANTTVSASNATAVTYNTLKYGVKVSTDPFTAIPLQPSLYFNFANRVTSTGTAIKTNTANAEEMFGQVGLTLNQFLVPNMKASVGYAYYQGFGVSNNGLSGLQVGTSSSGASSTYSAAADRIYNSPFSGGGTPFGGDNFGSAAGKLDGITAQVDWLGLQANWGLFRYYDFSASTANPMSVANAFKVSYTFKF